jgi:hypothetical protein
VPALTGLSEALQSMNVNWTRHLAGFVAIRTAIFVEIRVAI